MQVFIKIESKFIIGEYRYIFHIKKHDLYEYLCVLLITIKFLNNVPLPT